MSTFEGGKTRVRCVDCVRLSEDGRCSSKEASVAPRKRRSCASYQFKGEYVNRTAVQGTYVPYMDKKTQRIVRRLLELGVVPVRENSPPTFNTPDVSPLTKQVVSAPRSTATPQLLGVEPVEPSGLAEQPAEGISGNFLVSPEENNGEPDSNRDG
jgi:hypothetical protein